jgi:hypothetical protein
VRLSHVVVAALALSIGPAVRAQGSWGSPTTVCSVSDERLSEMSGIAVSRANPGLFYVHNDSGDTARFFAVNKSGMVLATVNVTNATAVDWEDIAVAYDTDCRPMVYLADIGDNAAARPEVAIYAVPEPKIPSGAAPQTIEATAKVLRFRYPDGAHDAETLMADWLGRALYVVTKAKAGSGVYRLEPKWDRPVQTAVKVGSVTFADPLPIYPNLATGGDISPDGLRMVVRTYQQAYEWRIPKGKRPDDVLGLAPTAYPLSLEPQGEAICYGSNSRTWLTTTEKLPAPVLLYTWTPETNAAKAGQAGPAKPGKPVTTQRETTKQ